MKKKLFAILMSAMMLVTFMPVASFAAVNQKSAEAITNAGIRTQLKFTASAYTGEQWAETYMNNYLNEVKTGKYKAVKDTAAMKEIVDKKSALVVDTMPTSWFEGRHIPGAFNVPAMLTNNNDVKYNKAEAVKAVKGKVGTVTKWYNKKTKKWTTTKPAKKYCGKSKKVTNFGKKIVVYCGFMGCSRSHELAKDLTAAGFTNVYRYAGGIAAWVDAGYDVEGADAQ